MNLSDLVKGILTGNIQKDTLSKQQLEDVIGAIELMKAALTPEQQKKNRAKAIAEGNKRAFSEANIKEPKKQDSESIKNESPKKTNHLTVIKEEGCLAKADEAISWSENGQWRLEKATKEGPTLNYGKIDPERNPISNPAAAREAKATRLATQEANAPTIDYANNPAVKPRYYSGAADRAKATQAKLEAESKETAAETIARRQGIKKDEGANIEREPASAERDKMTAKNEMMGYGGATPMTMSEKEPHKDDPEHEIKEKKKAKSIKEKAEELLDMHKADKESRSVFSMDHANQVLSMNHADAKSHLHDAVDGSTATPANKAKIKAAIEGTKNVKQLSGLVANHVLAAGGGGTKTGELKVIR